MSKQRLFLVATEATRPEPNVVRLRTTLVPPKVLPVGAASAQPRETSWRDLVRRLQKKLARR